MRQILVLCPQERDVRAVQSAGLEDRFAVRYAGPDLDAVTSFDAEAFLQEWEPAPADGVVGTKDRSALLAAMLAERRGLPGPTPGALLACQLKPRARRVMADVTPAATPRFEELNGRPSLEGPWFAKPVVGRLSQGARRVQSAAALALVEEDDDYRAEYARIAGLAGLGPEAVRGVLVEEFVEGDEVTLEGYVHGGRVTTIGVTDSVKYPGGDSFERFEYPSALPEARLAELRGVVERLLPALSFDGGFFNVEFLLPDEGPAQLVEVNGRIASQFAPLVQAVEGRSTYEALFTLAVGEDPRWEPRAPKGVAISYALRVFEDALVEAVPASEPNLEILVRPGLRLSEQGTNDTESYRLAIFYESAPTREEAVARCRERAASLDFRLR
jgi:hypothetical protein